MGNLFRKQKEENFLFEEFGVPDDLIRLIGEFCANNDVNCIIRDFTYEEYIEYYIFHPEYEEYIENFERKKGPILECLDSVNYVIRSSRSSLIIYAPRAQKIDVREGMKKRDYVIIIREEIKEEVLEQLLKTPLGELISNIIFKRYPFKITITLSTRAIKWAGIKHFAKNNLCYPND